MDSANRLATLLNKTHAEDCIAGMKQIPDGAIDMILCDLPYGTTRCAWDAVIPLNELWTEYRRVIRPDGAIALTAAQPFTSLLIHSNLGDYRYSWVWEKSKASGYLNAKFRPLMAHEDVLVFSVKRKPRYYPQMTAGLPYNKGKAHRPTEVYGQQRSTHVQSVDGLRYPRTVLYFKTAESEGRVVHPTQKPVALFQYLIQTYTQPSEVVLDCCMGSGTTAVASVRTGRKFIGFEANTDYAAIANDRTAEATRALGSLFD